MKHVILMRHATAGPADSDHERPLAPQGRREASRMGSAILALGAEYEPGYILCSSALRARETWDAVRASLPGAPAAILRGALYLASPGRLLSELQALPGGIDAVLLIAHEPGLSQLTRSLANRASDEFAERVRVGMAPGTLAVLRFGTAEWERLAPESGELVEFLSPRGPSVR